MHRRTRATLGLATVFGLAAAGLSAATAAQNGFTTDKSAGLAAQINPAKPRNVILLIGDGTDDSIITAARNYELGAAGRFALDELPFTGAMTTYGLKTGPGPVYPINYVSDSAPTASGWSTGKKTVDSRISQGPSSGDQVPGVDYETVLETYKKQGKRTGNVSTAEITDATPAAAASHINLRECQGPANMARCAPALKAAGGKGSISEQLVDNKVDVLLGGGRDRYAQTLPGSTTTVRSYAETANGYRVVDDEAGMAGITSLAGGPVLGLFAPINMTPRYQPLLATAAGAGGPSTRCIAADRGTQPTLAEMTDKAIKLLDNSNGFFLQVESAMVDKQEHGSDVCGAIGDVAELDEAVKVAQAYQATHPDTQIIVTGDHAHSTQIVPNGAGTVEGATGATGGKATTTLRTADGDPMTVAYSTQPPNQPNAVPPVATSQTHTGAQIRVAASGPQAANVTGTIDQTDLYATMLGRTPSTLPTQGAPATPPTQGTPPAAAPGLALAAAPSISRRTLRNGVPVSVAASNATSVTVQLLSRGEVLRTKTLPGRGDKVKLRTRSSVTGRLTVVATATGAGGTTTSRTKVATTR